MPYTYAQDTMRATRNVWLAFVGAVVVLVVGIVIGWSLHTPNSNVTATLCQAGYVAANSGNEPLGPNNTGPQAVIQTTRGEYAIYAGWMRYLKVGSTYRFTYTHDTRHDSDWVSAVPEQVEQGAACK